jgi:diguanylate cyclase (GGDEF)-like protein
MQISSLGLIVQTVGAGLLALIFLYLSRDNSSRVLRSAGVGWLFLFSALLALFLGGEMALPYATAPYQLFKILYFTALIVAADQMEHDSSLGRPLRLALLLGIPASAALAYFAGKGPLFYALHMGIGACAWFVITALIFRSRFAGLGKQFSGALALVTLLVHLTYVVFFSLSAMHQNETDRFLSYTGFYDLFLEMFFGIGLIIWAMEDTERKLTTIHARAIDDSQRSKRRAQMDPLTDAYNRFFLDEIRPALLRETAGGSIVLIDVDGLKTINDTEGHEEGDKAIWTVAQGIKKLIRGDDYLIRWGGDEFLVVLPGMDEEVAKKRFYMLPAKIDEVKQSPRTSQRAYRKFLAASVGVTPFSTRVPFDMAIELADRHMYERKKAHKLLRGDPLRRGSRDTPARDSGGVRRTTIDNKTN